MVLTSLQILRAVAALSVVFSHIQMDIDGRLHLKFHPVLLLGASGVDIFFVISGFIMVHASGSLFAQPRGTSIFLARRIARIVPTYWVTMTIYLLALVGFGSGVTLSLGWVVSSYLFLPTTSPAGVVMPVYGLGWTLNYEMFFYAVFAIAIALPRRSAVILVAGALIAFVLLGAIFPLPVPAAYWADSVVLEFVIGALLAYAYGSGIRLSALAGGALIVAGVSLLLISHHFHYFPAPTQHGEIPPRFVGWGLPAAMILAGAVFSPPLSSTGRVVRGLRLLGDSSYVIYLFHPFVFTLFQNRYVWSIFTRVIALATHNSFAALPYLYAASLLIGAIVVSVPVHLLLEGPASRGLARLFLGSTQRVERIQTNTG